MKLFVSFGYKVMVLDRIGIGNTIIDVDDLPNNYDDIDKFQKYVEKKTGIHNIVILNFIPLPEKTDGSI